MGMDHELESKDPLELFDSWLKQAEQSEPNDPNAAALATATSSGIPSVRMVLVKHIGDHRFCFFTNVESRKGAELQGNPKAALCLHWKSLRRQVRIEGDVLPLANRDVDEYFHSRPRVSQIGAAVSQQSRELKSREELEAQVHQLETENPGEIARPAYWRGFFLSVGRIEFWMDGQNRLHDRFLFTREAEGWKKARLYP